VLRPWVAGSNLPPHAVARPRPIGLPSMRAGCAPTPQTPGHGFRRAWRGVATDERQEVNKKRFTGVCGAKRWPAVVCAVRGKGRSVSMPSVEASAECVCGDRFTVRLHRRRKAIQNRVDDRHTPGARG